MSCIFQINRARLNKAAKIRKTWILVFFIVMKKLHRRFLAFTKVGLNLNLKKILRDEEIKRELKMVSFSIPKVFHVSVH